MYRRYAFACAYLACYLSAEAVYMLLSPSAQAALTGWASTNVANLEHEPVGPLLLSAFIGPGYFLVWPVLIALALFGANRALGNARTALICVAGQVIGTVVSESIVAHQVDAGQLPAAERYLTDVGPSYVVVSAIVIAVVCGTWPARAAAALDFAALVFGGHIFSGLSQLDVSAVGHLTALVTATAGVALIVARRGRPVPAVTRRWRTADREVVLEGAVAVGGTASGDLSGSDGHPSPRSALATAFVALPPALVEPSIVPDIVSFRRRGAPGRFTGLGAGAPTVMPVMAPDPRPGVG